MWEQFAMAADPVDPGTYLVLDGALKGTAIYMSACVLALALKRRTAALRHLVWSLAVVAALGLPVLSACLPAWELRLPVRRTAEIAREDPVVRTADLGASAEALLPASRPIATLGSSRARASIRPVAAPGLGRVPESDAGRWPRMLTGWRWVPWVWATGAVLCLLPTTAGLFSLWRLGR